jgi:hypothetical protein
MFPVFAHAENFAMQPRGKQQDATVTNLPFNVNMPKGLVLPLVYMIRRLAAAQASRRTACNSSNSDGRKLFRIKKRF